MNIRHMKGEFRLECIFGFAFRFMFSWVKYTHFAVKTAVLRASGAKSIYENRIVLSPYPLA